MARKHWSQSSRAVARRVPYDHKFARGCGNDSAQELGSTSRLPLCHRIAALGIAELGLDAQLRQPARSRESRLKSGVDLYLMSPVPDPGYRMRPNFLFIG